MSIKDDIKLVLTELSPILAGFKLAVMVVGYFGLGSVAKWIISYWYPFTRWVWDQVAIQLSFPELPLIVKDSLTALIFFLPLGITAIFQRIRGEDKDEGRHRISSALFGFLFLFLICKDVIGSIINSLSSLQEINLEPINSFVKLPFIIIEDASSIILPIYIVVIIAYLVVRLLARSHSQEEDSFFGSFLMLEDKVKNDLRKYNRAAVKISSFVSAITFPVFSIYIILTSGLDDASAIIGAFAILTVIVISLLLAIFYAPKKLFITTGAAIAFVLAAALFEGFMIAKSFMESVSSV